MTTAKIGIMVVMIAYLAVMLIVGFYASGKNKTVKDFYLGGRKLGPIVTAMSAEASDMSSYLLMGLPGLAYLTGMADTGWTIIGLAAGTYLNWLIVAKRLRRYSDEINAITIPSFFSKRYDDQKKLLTITAALIIIIFFIPYTASGFSACGKLFNSLFGVNYHTAMIVSAAVIIIYTMSGGFLAASMTDLIQSIVMTIALLIVLFFGVKTAGGMNAVIENAKSLPGYFSMTQSYDPATKSALAYGPITVLSTLAWGLGYFGMPHILLRFMAIDDENKIKTSRRIASAWVLIAMAIAILIGIIGLAVSMKGIVPLLEGNASETIIVELSNLMSEHGIFFALAAGLVLSGILACTMSTADSQLLAASSSVTSDLLADVFGIHVGEKGLLLISRLCLAIIAVLGVVLAWNSNSSVFMIVSFAWAGFGACFGPVMLLALFWKRSNKWGALFGMIAGGAMIFIWKFAIRPRGGIFGIYELLPAFIVAIVVNVIVSLITPAPSKKITDTFDRVTL